jgi:hypothetical protein
VTGLEILIRRKMISTYKASLSKQRVTESTSAADPLCVRGEALLSNYLDHQLLLVPTAVGL